LRGQAVDPRRSPFKGRLDAAGRLPTAGAGWTEQRRWLCHGCKPRSLCNVTRESMPHFS
jgi:hypothetical protein